MKNKNLRLTELFKKFDNCPICKREGNELQHILGAGKTENPKYLALLINPTYRNISSNPNWKGARFPFIGVKSLWKVFYEAEIIPTDTWREINKSEWNEDISVKVWETLENREIYLTNLVKCTSKNADYPSQERLNYHKGLFKKEVEIVKPQSIVTFGALPFKQLTGRIIKMEEVYRNLLGGKFTKAKALDYPVDVFPCYFPVGRGNPKRAAEMLRLVVRDKD